MSCDIAGAGEDILMLHGYLSSKESFYYQIKFLSEYFKVYAPDFPCFGASEMTDTAFSVGDYADWLLRFMDALEIEKADILAHSFGARVAFRFAAANNKRVRSLIITGGAGIVKPRSKAYMRRVKRYRRIKKLFPKFAERHFGSEEYRTLPPVMKESYKKIVNEDLSEVCKNISCPVYLIYGRDDKVTPPDFEGERFSRLLPINKFEIMDGGHFCFSENPEIFNQKILDFLRER